MVGCCMMILGAAAGVGGYMWWLKSQEDPNAPTTLAELEVRRNTNIVGNVTIRSTGDQSMHTEGGLLVDRILSVSGGALVRCICALER